MLDPETTQRTGVESALGEIKALVQNRKFARAEERLLEIIAVDNEHEEALYMLAVCQRYRQHYPTALETLGTLTALAPENGRAHQELGHTHRAMGNAAAALGAYSRAIQINQIGRAHV